MLKLRKNYTDTFAMKIVDSVNNQIKMSSFFKKSKQHQKMLKEEKAYK